MKKFALFVALIASLVACRGKEWNTEDEIYDLSESWSYGYVDCILDMAIVKNDTLTDGKYSVAVLTSILKDTLYRELHHINNSEYGDSVDVVSTFVQFGDTTILTVNGYRYSKNFYAHLFTSDPGIINHEGKFHIDFYETGKTTPWAWSEITYSKGKRNASKIGWY